jgi:TonB family protein
MRSKTILVLGIFAATFVPRIVSAQTQSEPEGKIAKVGPGVSPPRLTYSPEPEFSETARAAGYQGVSTLSLIVGVDGKPHNIRVLNALGMGLDEKAVAAVSAWRFSPALKDGKPLAVEIAVEVDFHLYGRSGSTFTDLREKAQAGNAKAQLDLANFFLKHRDIPENERLGLSYLEKAANQGFPPAQSRMGEYITEKSGPADYAKAYMWYTLAHRGGDKHGDKSLKKLIPKMTPEQIQQGQTLADNWRTDRPAS